MKSETSTHEVTQLLRAWGAGNKAALDQLAPLVYREVHRLAERYMAGERHHHTLQPTALVNEAYLRLVNVRQAEWQDRVHFLAICARAMRQILVDHARARGTAKRGAGQVPLQLQETLAGGGSRQPNLLEVDEALRKLAAFDPRKSQVVELRFFGGLSVEEAAEVLKISLRTVQRDWKLARAWLYRELSRERRHEA